MCSICQAIPLILDKKIVLSNFNYNRLAIRYLDKKWFFTLEYFHLPIVQVGVYCSNPNNHVCSSCLRRNIENKSIHWLPHDYGNYPGTNMIDVGNELLDRALRLRSFL